MKHLGSSKSSSRENVELYDLPDDADGICALVRQIIEGGSVRRLEIALDEPIRVVRAVEDNEFDERPSDLDFALRNVSKMVECSSENTEPALVILRMSVEVARAGLRCCAWATGSIEALSKWLNIEIQIDHDPHLLDRRVEELKSLPAETLVLCAAEHEHPQADEITLVIKTVMETKHDHELPRRKAPDPVRNGAREDGSSAHQLAIPPGNLCRSAWKSGGVSGK